MVDTVEFYWRPGCGFCMALERRLTSLGIPLDKRNIWEDPGHAATVRSIANGNETVPTVVIGDVQLVNPKARQVLQALSDQAPHLIPEGVDVPEPGAGKGFVSRLLGN